MQHTTADTTAELTEQEYVPTYGSTDGEPPLVSVIIPVYNVEKFLDANLTSVTQQTYRRLEILVVDDGSPDNSGQIADDWATKDPRIRVIHQKNKGLSGARNTGLAQAKGDYILFVDSDDTIEPTLVRSCLAHMRRGRRNIVMYQFDTMSEDGTFVKSRYVHNRYSKRKVLTPEEAIRDQIAGKIGGYAWSFMAPTSIYRENNITFPEGRAMEDLARICQIFGGSDVVIRLPFVLYHYRLRANSIMGTASLAFFKAWKLATQDRENYVLERFPQLRSYILKQKIEFLSTVDYESLLQTIVFRLNLDPESTRERKETVKALFNEGESDEFKAMQAEYLATKEAERAQRAEQRAAASKRRARQKAIRKAKAKKESLETLEKQVKRSALKNAEKSAIRLHNQHKRVQSVVKQARSAVKQAQTAVEKAQKELEKATQARTVAQIRVAQKQAQEMEKR